MRYALLIYSESDAGPAPDSPEMAAEMGQWHAYTNELEQADALRGGEALQEIETATTLRIRDGQRLVTDGPFAETKEVLGGFYLIEAPDLDAALDWAAGIPAIAYGSVEVRPLMEIPDE